MNKRKKATSSRTARKARAAPAPRKSKGPAASAPEMAVPPQSAAEAGPTTLAFAAECLVADASRLKSDLTGLLSETQPVTLDVSGLQRVDTASLQLITAFVLQRARHGLSVEWRGAAPALANAARLLGLTSLLNLPA
jgi:ABC-type transporter Mla MlaB component